MSKRIVCPHCGTVQPGRRASCINCGSTILPPDEAKMRDYIDRQFYYKPGKAAKAAAIFAFVLAAAEIIVAIMRADTHNIAIFVLAVPFAIAAGLGYLFPATAYRLCSIPRHFSYYHKPDDYDDPYPNSIRYALIILSIFLAVSLAALIIFLLFPDYFAIPSPVDFSQYNPGEDIVIIPGYSVSQ